MQARWVTHLRVGLKSQEDPELAIRSERLQLLIEGRRKPARAKVGILQQEHLTGSGCLRKSLFSLSKTLGRSHSD